MYLFQIFVKIINKTNTENRLGVDASFNRNIHLKSCEKLQPKLNTCRYLQKPAS